MSWQAVAGLGGVALTLVGPVLVRLGMPSLAGMGISVLGALIGLAGAIGILLSGGAPPMAIVSVVPFVAFLLFCIGHRKYPVMNDITTDLDDPPAFVAASSLAPNAKRDLTYKSFNVAMQREHYPGVKPLKTRAVPTVVFNVAKQAAEDFDWALHASDDAERTYEAVSTDGQFQFRDDVSLRVRADGGVTTVDVRSKARDGRADFGANAQRIADLLAAIRVRLPADLEVE